MKVIDYVIKDIKNAVSYDEAHNLYIDYAELSWLQQDVISVVPFQRLDETTVFMCKEDCDKYNQYDIIIPEDLDCDSNVRRPYYRMRGKPVTKEQAFGIIRRTDRFLGDIDKIRCHEDFVGGGHFDNWIINKNHYPQGYGWIHADGTVGTNGITYKYPEIPEFLEDCLRKLMHFPYLDFMAAVTCWNEIPDEAWVNPESEFHDKRLFEYESYDSKFYEAVVMGIHAHDKTIEFLMPNDAIEKYKEYVAKYEKKREIYISDYYNDNKIEQVSLEELKKFIESYGLDADKELSRIPEYMWKGN